MSTISKSAELPNRFEQERTNSCLERIAAAAEDIAAEQRGGTADAYALATLDGTAAGFRRAMKLYMNLHKITDNSTPADITTAVTGFYDLLQKNYTWDGYVKFYDPDVASLSTGEKCGDNAGLVCIPSSAESKGQDDYEGLPLFATIDCNWVIDDTSLAPTITAIDGIVGNFKRYDPATFVGVLQMTGYHYYTNPGESSNQFFIDGIRIGMDKNRPNCKPLPEAVNVDGTIRPWVVHGKYPAGLKDGKLTNCSGVPEAGDMSHNNSQTYAHNIGPNYSGMTSCDLGFIQIMSRIKFASLTLDGILDHCKGYEGTAIAQVAESGVKRIIIPASGKGNFVVGSNIQIGTGASTDRQVATSYSISGKNGYTVTDVTDVTINGTQYAAVYVDASGVFDTKAGDADKSNNTQIMTIRWKTGSTDSVPGNTGAINPTSGTYPVKIQGIEFGLGAYETLSDTILNFYADEKDPSKSWIEAYTVKKAAKQTTSVTADYTGCGAKCDQAQNEGYIKAQTWGSDGVLMPTRMGGSSSSYARDCFWHKTGVFTREWLVFGSLVDWAAAGLSFVNGDHELGDAWWGSAARLSPNGNRG